MAIVTREEICKNLTAALNSFLNDIVTRCSKIDTDNYIYFWHIKLIEDQQSNETNEIFNEKVISVLSNSIQEYMEELERLNNNPYADFVVYNALAVVNMRRLLQAVKRHKVISNKMTAIVTGFVGVSDQNFGYLEEIEEAIHALLTEHASIEDSATKETVVKLVSTTLDRLRTFVATPFNRTDDVADLQRSYKADVLLAVSVIMISFLISNKVEDETVLASLKAAASEMNNKTAVKVQPILRSSLKLYHDYLAGDLKGDFALSSMNDGDHIDIVTKYSRQAVNTIFKQALVIKVKEGDDRVCKFYRHACDSMAKNRNSILSYHVFESVMVVALEDLEPATAAYISEKLIEACDIESAAFRLRRTAAMAIRLMLNSPAKINNIVQLIKYLVIKEETRPRDTSILIDLRDYIHQVGMFEELMEERAIADSYHAFPRLLTNCCIDRVISRLPELTPAEQEAFDQFSANIFEDFFYGYFVEANETRHVKPFEEKHRIMVRKMHTLVILSKYLRTGKLL